MNIIVSTSNGNIVYRPDTSWSRKSDDIFFPDFVGSLSYAPVMFARISRPGRWIDRKFASRYYDRIGFGILLYSDELTDRGSEGYAMSLCLDKTSVLPVPTLEREELSAPGSILRLYKGERSIFEVPAPSVELVSEAIERATRLSLVRAGDFIAVELSPAALLGTKIEGDFSLKGTWRDAAFLDFKIIWC